MAVRDVIVSWFSPVLIGRPSLCHATPTDRRPNVMMHNPLSNKALDKSGRTSSLTGSFELHRVLRALIAVAQDHVSTTTAQMLTGYIDRPLPGTSSPEDKKFVLCTSPSVEKYEHTLSFA
jgi:hypothetical protein